MLEDLNNYLYDIKPSPCKNITLVVVGIILITISIVSFYFSILPTILNTKPYEEIMGVLGFVSLVSFAIGVPFLVSFYRHLKAN